jgi:hypothetical protein
MKLRNRGNRCQLKEAKRVGAGSSKKRARDDGGALGGDDESDSIISVEV